MKFPYQYLSFVVITLLLSCSPGAIDLPPYVLPPSAPLPQVSANTPINLTIDPELSSENIHWEANYYRYEEETDRKNNTYDLEYFGEISIPPGVHSLKIQNWRMPREGEYGYWSQKSKKVDLKRIKTITLSVIIYTRYFTGQGLELIVDWGNSYQSLMLSKDELTNVPGSGPPTINAILEVPVSPDMVKNVDQFTVKLGVLPGVSGEVFFDEVYLLAQ